YSEQTAAQTARFVCRRAGGIIRSQKGAAERARDSARSRTLSQDRKLTAGILLKYRDRIGIYLENCEAASFFMSPFEWIERLRMKNERWTQVIERLWVRNELLMRMNERIVG